MAVTPPQWPPEWLRRHPYPDQSRRQSSDGPAVPRQYLHRRLGNLRSRPPRVAVYIFPYPTPMLATPPPVRLPNRALPALSAILSESPFVGGTMVADPHDRSVILTRSCPAQIDHTASLAAPNHLAPGEIFAIVGVNIGAGA